MGGLAGARVLITGGAGFVGSHIADLLVDEGVEEVLLLDNLLRGSRRNVERAIASGRARLVEGDIRDRALLDRLLPGVDYVFHMAALRITRCAENPREALEVMYDGTFNVVEGCVRHRVRKLVAASSASVYGTADLFPTAEAHHPYNNRTLYGAAKLANELLYRAFNDMFGLPYLALRYFNIYGPRMDREGKYTEVLIRWYGLIREGQQPLIFGEGDQTMDFVYVEDVARANVMAMKADASDEVFNVASQRETSLRELCCALLRTMGSPLQPRHVPLPAERKAVEVRRRLADTSAARARLGFEAQVPLEEGLLRLVRWLDLNGETVR
ncbi:MAG TPA: NAD-dependent epimerase/dehydratase family protein [Vicinamibacteria bacterium]|nr:NAD-dependent epimerase/dehydratase family protein [Vicinamibacteria bacterium]